MFGVAKKLIRNKVLKNAFWIIFCRVIQAILNLIVTMLSARYLGPSGYGLVNYAASVVAFATPIMMLGLNSILVQEIVNSPEKEGEALGTSLAMTFITSFLTIGGVVSFVAIANRGEKDTIIVCALYSILLVFQSLELIQYWFQAKLKSKYPSMIMLFAYIIVSIYKIILLITGRSIYWFAISQAIDYFIIAILLFVVYAKFGTQRLKISWKRAKSMFSKSRYYIISSLMVTIFAQTDRIMLKIMIDDSATGFYSAAVTCAGMTGFIFSAIIDSARPAIFERKKNSQEEFEKGVSRLYSVIIYFALLQSLLVTLLAQPIVYLLYGKEYNPSINALRLIVWYTTFSYIGAVRNIWILAEGQQKILGVLNLSGALLNVILNYILIPIWGIMGASFASLLTQIFTNVIMGFIVHRVRRNNILMLKGLNPKYLFDLIRN